ncbi:MAG TPA: bifunctional hydroxymethylpyrimidine kinase/phosphomethylpyrimidine kinase, partial [Holophagaceae bacterium]|nr:bifunctional hydroxymethylpyrimidine kinase/phosphomethylpyrimidine kinase [Holophagaceae bacterium]
MPPPHTTPPVALCLGGMDPSGGAGLIRDALTLARLGVHPMAVSTAETLQNGLGCQAIQGPCMDPVARIETLGPHLTGAWGVKLGLCALETAVVKRLVATLNALHPRIRIWDPILAPSAGVGLHDGGELRELARILLSGGAWVVSPNRGEAAAIAGLAPDQIRVASPESLSRPLLELGAAAVWLKGGHTMGDTVQDLWITPTRIEALPAA